MTDDVDTWIAAYRRAWESNEPDDIRALFTTDALYRTEPWTEPWRGVEQIVAGWLERADEPGSARFDWERLVVSGDIATVHGTTAYADGRIYSNFWVIRLAPDGRAREFTEWWMDQSNPS